MAWSPEKWQESLDNLIEECGDKVLQELENEIMERLKAAGHGIINQVFLHLAPRETSKSESGQTLVFPIRAQDSDVIQALGMNQDQSEDSGRFGREEFWFAFAVTCAWERIPAGLSGIDGFPLSMVQEGDLGLVVCPVPSDEYNEASLHAHLEDLEWVETRVRKHEDVLLELMETVALVPLSFCTIFNDLDRIKHTLRENEGSFKNEIAKLGGRSEMSLILLADTRRLQEKVEVRIPYSGSLGGGGYFQRRQWEKQVEDEAERLMDFQGESLFAELSKVAQEAKLRGNEEVQNRQRQGVKVIFAAYFLLRREQREQWESALSEFDKEADSWGYILEVSGPWPPYHFSGTRKEENEIGGNHEFETSDTPRSGGEVAG